MALTLDGSLLRSQRGGEKGGRESERKGKWEGAKGDTYIIWYRPCAWRERELTDARSGADAAERNAYARGPY